MRRAGGVTTRGMNDLLESEPPGTGEEGTDDSLCLANPEDVSVAVPGVLR